MITLSLRMPLCLLVTCGHDDNAVLSITILCPSSTMTTVYCTRRHILYITYSARAPSVCLLMITFTHILFQPLPHRWHLKYRSV